MLLLLQHSRVADCLFRLGGSTTLSCQVDTAKCGDYHSIKWYRDGVRVAVYSNIHTFRSVTVSKSHTVIVSHCHTVISSVKDNRVMSRLTL